MTERERIIEVLDAIENGMCKIAETRDIWQNDLIYALCEGERILLTARLKELNKKKKEPEKKVTTCRDWIENNHPECVYPEFAGGIRGCPDNYGLLDLPFCCNDRSSDEFKCRWCWDRIIQHEPIKE